MAQSEDAQRLVSLISGAVRNLEATYTAAQCPLPSLAATNGSLNSPPECDTTRDAMVMSAACDQLKAMFAPPARTMIHLARSGSVPAALRVAIEAHVCEGIKAGHQGVTVSKLAEPTGIDPGTLARCLRLLADHHVFREVHYDVFANTRLSLALDTGKPIDKLAKLPEEAHYVDTDGVAACCCFEAMFMAPMSSIPDWVRHQREQANSTSLGSEPVCNNSFKLWAGLDLFDWLQASEARLVTFHAAMWGSDTSRTPRHVPRGGEFPWKDLSQGALVVDVGGGNGGRLYTLLKAFPHLRFVVQDLPEVEARFTRFWRDKDQKMLESGRISFQVHNFFDENPVKGAAVYSLMHVLHDWPDDRAQRILSRIVDAASPESYVVIFDAISPTAYPTTPASSSVLKSNPAMALPAPLVSPTRANACDPHALDMSMLLLNGLERTASQWTALAAAVGIEIVAVGYDAEDYQHVDSTLTCAKKA